jgi:hypothetical protein
MGDIDLLTLPRDSHEVAHVMQQLDYVRPSKRAGTRSTRHAAARRR